MPAPSFPGIVLRQFCWQAAVEVHAPSYPRLGSYGQVACTGAAASCAAPNPSAAAMAAPNTARDTAAGLVTVRLLFVGYSAG